VTRRVWVVAALFGLVACSSGGDPAPSPTPSPTPPVLGEDYALLGPLPGVLDAAPDPTSFDPAQALLTGPHFSFSVPAVASVTGALPAGVATGLHLATGMTVPPGHQLLVAEITGPATGRAVSGPVGSVTIVVADGAEERPIRGGATALTTGTLAVVLPEGATPLLKVTDAGRTQSLDLTSGRRGTDAIAGYYPVRTGTHEGNDATATSVRLYGAAVAALSTQERLATVALNDLPVDLLPYAEGRGWAKPGRAWAVVTASVGYVRATDPTKPDVVVVPPSCFTATGPGGTRVTLSGQPIRIGEGGTTPAAGRADTTLTGDVPASLRQLTVVFRFCGTITTAAGQATYRPDANPTQTARITLT
jgi:hypothetical protein